MRVPDPEKIHLTPTESDLLVRIATAFERRMYYVGGKDKRAMTGLVKKELVIKTDDAFWTITDRGQKRTTSIY